jgi:hypothetical protein
MEYTFVVRVTDSPWPITFSLCLADRNAAIEHAISISGRLDVVYGPDRACTHVSVRNMEDSLDRIGRGCPR